MKKDFIKLRRFCSLLAGAILIGAPIATHAALAPDPTESYSNSFDAATDLTSWIYWYGVSPGNAAVAWDGTKDAATNSGSGSMSISIPFGDSGNQQVWFGTFHNGWGYDGTTFYNGNRFTNILVDILVDPTAPVSPSGDFGTLEYSLIQSEVPNGGGPFSSTRIPASASNGWVRLNMPVPVGVEGYDDPGVIGVCFKYSSYSGYPKSPINFWMDNLKVQISEIQLPPPTLSPDISSASPGLNLLSAPSGGEFQRTSVKANTQTGIGFAGQPDVTYSFTIKEFPNPAIYPNYQAHLFLATGPGSVASFDYNETNLLWLNVQGSANGGGTAYFRYKINEPNSNANMFGAEYADGDFGTPWAGQLASLAAATPIGTWSMTFHQDTNVTLSGPGGVTTNFTIRPEIPAQFIEPLNFVFGAQPNRYSEELPLFNIGQKVVLAAVGITKGGTPVVYDNFLAESTLDTAKFSTLSSVANTVFLFPNDPGQKLVKWSLPDTGFYLERSANLTQWSPVSAPVSFAIGSVKTALVPSAGLNPNQNFFRMVKRGFTKLQVLLPGETAAPGTATGKTGTPLPQQAGVAFSIVVNAVDKNWVHITSATDQISLSSSDAAFNWPNFPGTMEGGTVVFDADHWALALGTPGSQTITAIDMTDPAITSGTSSSVTVNP